MRYHLFTDLNLPLEKIGFTRECVIKSNIYFVRERFKHDLRKNKDIIQESVLKMAE